MTHEGLDERKAVHEIIDIDLLSEWCVPVRIRGRLIETRNPLREDMTLLDRRLKRGDYANEAELGRARTALLDEMIERLFVGERWEQLKRAIRDGQDDPLSSFEKLSIVLHYSIAYLHATQGREAASALALRGLTLIEEEATPQAASAPHSGRDLPEGRFVAADGRERPLNESGIGMEGAAPGA